MFFNTQPTTAVARKGEQSLLFCFKFSSKVLWINATKNIKKVKFISIWISPKIIPNQKFNPFPPILQLISLTPTASPLILLP